MDFKNTKSYSNNFESLILNMPSLNDQQQYCNRWLKHYADIIKNSDKIGFIDWEIRSWKSIKEIYASAIFYKEAEYAYANRCMSSYYFLLYYSLFHAMWSTLCYSVNINIETLLQLTHQNLGNSFKNTFCTGNNAIVKEEIYTTFTQLKLLREYYSYTPPLNLSLYKEEYIKKLDECLTQCFQLSNLHSFLLEKSFQKHGCIQKISTSNEREYFLEMFKKAVAPKNTDDNNCILDEADNNRKKEILCQGVGGYTSIRIELDHTFDEFRSYNDSSRFFSKGISSQDIYSYIYDKIV